MPDEIQPPDWPSFIQHYFATGTDELLVRAIAAARDRRLKKLIDAYRRQDVESFGELFEIVANSLATAGSTDEHITLHLLREDFQVEMLQAFEGNWPSGAERIKTLGNSYNRAISLANQLANPLPAAFYHFRLGELLWAYGRREPAVVAYEAAVASFRKAGLTVLPNDSASALNNLGLALRAVGNYTRALIVFEEAVALRRTLPVALRGQLAETLTNAANVYHRLGDDDKARCTVNEAISILETTPAMTLELAGALSNLSLFLSGLNDHGTARLASEKAVGLYRALDRARTPPQDDSFADVLDNLATVYLNIRQLQLAGPIVEEGLLLRRRRATTGTIDAKRALAGTLNNVGLLALSLTDFARARSAMEEASGIYRELAEIQPRAYASELVQALNNLAFVLSRLNDFASANALIEESLSILDKIVTGAGTADVRSVARGLTNLGAVLTKQKELTRARLVVERAIGLWEGVAVAINVQKELAMAYTSLGEILRGLKALRQASDALARAVDCYRKLTVGGSEAHDANLSTALSIWGTVLSESGDFDSARALLEEAVELRRRISAREPSLVADYAESLNNLGIFLYRSGQLDEAIDVLERAVGIDRELYKAQPDAYALTIAGSLNNLGRALCFRGDYGDADLVFREAIAIHVGRGSNSEAAGTLLNQGLLEMAGGNHAAAIRLFQKSVRSLESGLSALEEEENRDKFKSDFGAAYRYLIYHYAMAGPRAVLRLVGALESQRQTTTLSGAWRRAMTGTSSWRRIVADLRRGSGKWSALFEEHRAAFLWVHCTDEGVIFSLLRPGSITVYSCGLSFLSKMTELHEKVELLSGSSEFEDLLTFASVHSKEFESIGRAAFAELPPGIQLAIDDKENSVLFLSACPLSIHVPFELLVGSNNRYVGLGKLFVRIRALAEIETLLRSPQKADAAAVIIGNPTHIGASYLSYSENASMELTERLRERDWLVHTFMNGAATSASVLERLAASISLALFVYMGHGAKVGKISRLLLAGKDTLSPEDLLRLGFRGNPVVHLDCCFSAATESRGGGSFEGYPMAALAAGASAVLSSFHPLHDVVAAQFSSRLYQELLSAERHVRLLGPSLLETRRWIDEQYGGNPLTWATTILWGNPWADLPG